MTDIELRAENHVLTVTFNRPEQRNAMTWEMYAGLEKACEQADSSPDVRAMVLRGAGGKAFVAGTDIAQFAGFSNGEDGVDYERRITTVLRRLEAVAVPTIASIDGYCVGGGLGIACAVDIRVATPRSRFGVPIARTLGNCLSGAALDLLVRGFGRSRATSLLLTARLMGADEALAAGFLTALDEDVTTATATIVDGVVGQAPLSMWASKQALRRLHRDGPDTDLTDIVSRVYGSADFHNAVASFLAKQPPTWSDHH
ncbi:enoyl-CoA hydratase [Pseudonocardia spinosispora]|uniref:enoyl-CoA hydratase n=1 Tax=Pseudonocardia spinosispora TaxID=103441 RepID=UPI000412F454|nr:enoyl-CoA hydratase [Pseudonocardia spinosispora]